MKNNYCYSFITTWKIRAPLHQVWDVLYNQEDWPSWWKGVIRVELLQNGDANSIGKKMRYTWKSFLPYSLRFDMTSSSVIPYSFIEGNAAGELEGIGRWYFEQHNDITVITYTWDVNTTKKWMNTLAPLLKHIFKWNHDVVMRWGAEGLAKKLDAELLEA